MIKTHVYSILERQVSEYLLNGYKADVIDAEVGRFYAYTFVNLRPEDYEIASSLSRFITSGCSVWGSDEEKSRVYSEGGRCYSMKSHDQCIQEGLYHAYAIKFYGCFYDGWWYILKELSYFGEHISREAAQDRLSAGGELASFLNNTIYLPMEPYFSISGQDEEKLPRGVEYLEFVGIPELVAYQKQQQKSAICRAFTHFMNQDIFLPFKERLRVFRYEEFSALTPLYSNDFTMIYPNTREYILIPAFVKDIQGTYRLYYFFWHTADRKMYTWTYFEPEVAGINHHYSSVIIENLSKISHWNEIGYLDSSCTLDDRAFWNNYVLVKAPDGEYKYLTELSLGSTK
ncbi:hypothetical protein [Chitinophaga sp. 212800010-3]|uniref:hypothetical protein n=1 Tax=unclassified Chitinophaga TaxID=2619133 RepID=UPI002DF43B93|nr:hypothetical protein [Chitinophaga sp. 212800010-3]